MSWNDTNIITASTVKEVCGIAVSVEDRKINPSIHFAQRDVRQLLGQTLYDLIELADPVVDPTLGNAGLLALYDGYVKPYLAWKSMEQAMPSLWAEPDRNGVFQRNGNDYTTIGASGLNVLIAQNRKNAEAFSADMLRYLRNLDDADAVKIAFDTDIDSEPRTTKPATGRIMFPKRRNGFDL